MLEAIAFDEASGAFAAKSLSGINILFGVIDSGRVWFIVEPFANVGLASLISVQPLLLLLLTLPTLFKLLQLPGQLDAFMLTELPFTLLVLLTPELLQVLFPLLPSIVVTVSLFVFAFEVFMLTAVFVEELFKFDMDGEREFREASVGI